MPHEVGRAVVAGQLQKYGFTVQATIGGTGVVGVLANGAGPTVLLRAELDGLPIRKDTGVDYAKHRGHQSCRWP